MPTLAKPRSDRDRLELLEKSLETGKQELLANRTYIFENTINELQTFIPIFMADYMELIGKKGKILKETAEQRDAFADLKTYCRDMSSVAKKRISRLKQPPAVFSFYMMTQNGEITYPTNMEQWLTLANKLIQGDAEAVKAGYPAMSNPSAVELQVILDSTQSEYNDAAMADRDHDIVQENLAKHRTVADKLINSISP